MKLAPPNRRLRAFLLPALASLWFITPPVAGQESGPETEKRFPTLTLPPAFQATLFACDPLIEYPSVIALGPRPGTVFVAHDYMTGLGTEIVRRDEIRLVEDTDGDGYADKSILFAGEFNSLQGLAYHAGTVYAMHAPILTALRDTDGDGAADERRDLFTGLGLPPEDNPTRLHCANGVAVGHDGWLYLAMGDNGTDVARPEGDRLVLQGGGILRCRPDGRDLHVFATGLRNIYDVAFDEELNVFVRDNENDGGDYMIRVCHSFFGADHGYPYLYYERPSEALPPLADLGRGSSAGITCYLETAFPPEFRGNLFCCEWGRSVVRYERQRSGSSFANMQEHEFAAAAANDPYGLKPTDIIVDRDGSLLVSDWGDGQRPKRGRGRIYRITHAAAAGPADVPQHKNRTVTDSIARFDAPGYYARLEAHDAVLAAGEKGLQSLRSALDRKNLGPVARMHAVWLLAAGERREDVSTLFMLAENDDDLSVRAQAVRAIADLLDPVLVEHRLDVGSGDAEAAERLASLAENDDPRVMLEVIIALGRLRWAKAPEWLDANLAQPDAALAHAAMQTLRRCENWQAVIKLLDLSDDRPMRQIALRAFADRADPYVVDALIERLAGEGRSDRRREYADLLTRVWKLPGPWTYWGYRPGPRPANSAAWERTSAIEDALNRTLADPDRDLRAVILKRMQREQIPVRIPALSGWLGDDRDAQRVAVVLDSLAQAPPDEVREMLAGIVQDAEHAEENRRRALSLFLSGAGESHEARLVEIAQRLEDGPVLVAVIRELAQRPQLSSRRLLLGKLECEHAEVRAAAIKACVDLKIREAANAVPKGLEDENTDVRLAAVIAAGEFGVNDAVGSLLNLAAGDNPEIRGASLESLRLLDAPQAVGAAQQALHHPASQLAAIDYLAQFGGPDHAGTIAAAASNSRSMEVLAAVVGALAKWGAAENSDSPHEQNLRATLAEVQGHSGVLLNWNASEPVLPEAAAPLRTQQAPHEWRYFLGAGAEARIELPAAENVSAAAVWVALAEVSLPEATRAQFLASSNSTLEVWLNGFPVHRREKPAPFQADSDRFEAELYKGINRIAVQLVALPEAAKFHMRFRPISSSAEHERLTRYALGNSGDAARGREVFFNTEKSLCLKCHRLDEQGGQIGPQLTGLGDRFSRIHLIESILTPSRTIAPSYETVSAVLASGIVITGVKIEEDGATLILGDEKGERHEIAKSQIDERVTQPKSTMPEGLEKRLTDREFLDLLAFLAAQKRLAAEQ
jgi:putative membrane-bound dehydrogenase-like protein